MLMYDLHKRELSEENIKLLQINRHIIASIAHEVSSALLRNRAAAEPKDEVAAKDEFMILVSLALQHGIEAAAIANRLGVTISTVHRWARGTFVPAQSFVREAALASIQDLLQGEMNRFPGIDHEEGHERQLVQAPDGSVPKIDVDARKSGGEPVETVVPLRTASPRRQRRSGSSSAVPVGTSKVF